MHIPHNQPRFFTLLEMLVSMSILSILLLMLMHMLVMSQTMWQRNSVNAQVFESAWVALDVIEQDIRSLITSSVPGREIGYYLGNPMPTTSSRDFHACVVAAIDPPVAANSQLCEISYFHHIDPSERETQFILRRQVVTDRSGSNWNFYGQPADWHVNPAVATERLVSGVETFKLTFFDQEGQIVEYDSGRNRNPARVEIFLLLFDEGAMDLPPEKRQETRRGFTRIIELSREYK